ALYRLDLVSLGIPGASGDLNALATTLIGPGGATLLFDGATGALTAWSTRNRTYYVAAPPRSAPAAAAAPTTTPATPNDPLATLAALVASLHDVQSASLQLVGHTTVNGHPASDVAFDMKRQIAGHGAEEYRARLALADDLGGFPLQISLQSIAAPGSGGQNGAAKLDLTQVRPGDQPDMTFVLPAGYTRVETLAGILQGP
ncbi:MAG: hypothetical protein JOZ24_08240, partial [Candidatus Eremiobacteraeota bacterium]|nr:hypothetical protein [Candidatus Eremiobacteraeota bacterium]